MGLKLLRTELKEIFETCRKEDLTMDKRKEELLKAVVNMAEQAYMGILAKYENLAEPTMPISRYNSVLKAQRTVVKMNEE